MVSYLSLCGGFQMQIYYPRPSVDKYREFCKLQFVQSNLPIHRRHHLSARHHHNSNVRWRQQKRFCWSVTRQFRSATSSLLTAQRRLKLRRRETSSSPRRHRRNCQILFDLHSPTVIEHKLINNLKPHDNSGPHIRQVQPLFKNRNICILLINYSTYGLVNVYKSNYGEKTLYSTWFLVPNYFFFKPWLHYLNIFCLRPSRPNTSMIGIQTLML